MQNALVIGSTGSFGAAMVRELTSRGWNVRALRRSPSAGASPAGVTEVRGDALALDDVMRAAKGMDVIVHGYNAPYPEWRKTMLPAARNVARAAIDSRACILLPGNVYGLGPEFEQPLDETAPRRAPTAKGALRNELEAELEKATASGAQLINVRAGDYFGPDAMNTWFYYMTRRALKGGALVDLGRAGVRHEWAYLPDLARYAASLLERRRELGHSETFHMSSHQLTSSQLLGTIRDALGGRPRRVWKMPWRSLRLLGAFVPMLREIVEIKYLWDVPVLLDDTKLRSFLGDPPRTTLEHAVEMALFGQSAREPSRKAPLVGAASGVGPVPAASPH